jgi:hypothetical protein
LPGTHQGWWLMMNSEHSPLEWAMHVLRLDLYIGYF